MGNRTVTVDGTGLNDAREVLDAKWIPRKGIFGVPSSTFRAAAVAGAKVKDEWLRGLSERMLDEADTVGRGREVFNCLQRVVDSADAAPPYAVIDIARRGSDLHAAMSPLPLTSEFLTRRHAAYEAAGSDDGDPQADECQQTVGVDKLVAEGKRLYEGGNCDDAAEVLELALASDPVHPAANLYAARSCLDARRDYSARWRRAKQLIDATLRDLNPPTARWAQWQFLLAVAEARNPDAPPGHGKFAKAADAIKPLIAYFQTGADRLAELHAELTQAILRFRSLVPLQQHGAIKTLKDAVVRLKGGQTAYWRAIALKLLGNCLQLIEHDEHEKILDDVARYENLKESVRHYKGSLKILTEVKHRVLRAQVLYSMADAYVAMAVLSRESQCAFLQDSFDDRGAARSQTPKATRRLPKIAYDKRSQDAFKCCEEALDLLNKMQEPQELANAKFNDAERICKLSESTGRHRINEVEHAVALYLEVLREYPRDYILEEWCITHISLVKAYKELSKLEGDDATWMALAVSSMKAVSNEWPKFGAELDRLERQYAKCRSAGKVPFESIPAAK